MGTNNDRRNYPGSIVVPIGMKSSWSVYRTALTSGANVDTVPVSLRTPAIVSAAYHHASAVPAAPPNIIMGGSSHLFVRVRLTNAGSNANVFVVGWPEPPDTAIGGAALVAGSESGVLLDQWNAVATPQTDGTLYLSPPRIIPIEFCQLVHIFVSSVSAGTAIVDIARGSDRSDNGIQPYTEGFETWVAAVTNPTKTLAVLKGSALNLGLKELLVWPEDTTDDIRYNIGGAATAATTKVPPGGVSFPVTKDIADKLQFFAAAPSNLMVQEFA